MSTVKGPLIRLILTIAHMAAAEEARVAREGTSLG